MHRSVLAVLVVSCVCLTNVALFAVASNPPLDDAGSQTSTDAAAADPWIDAGGDPAVRDSLLAIMEQAVANGEVPGVSVRILHGDAVVFDEARGLADVSLETPFPTDGRVHVASMTKMLTATLVAIAVDRNVVSFDDSVAKYIPEFNDIRHHKTGAPLPAPTIRQCLSHTAGFRSNAEIDGAFFEEDSPTLAGVVRGIVSHGLVAAPGSSYRYSRHGFDVAAYVLERATGELFQDLLDEHLVKPLGMTSTSFEPSDDLLQRYTSRGQWGTFVPRTPVAPLRGSYVNAGGGLLSNADDLATFFSLHANWGVVDSNEIIARSILEEMYQIQKPARSYGLGFMLDAFGGDGIATKFRHGGGSGVTGWHDRRDDVTCICFTQLKADHTSALWLQIGKTLEGAFADEQVAGGGGTRAPEPSRIDVLFDRADRNGDGFVDEREYPAKASERLTFAAIDINDDKRITVDEFRRAVRRMRDQ